MRILMLGINHQTAPVELRERLAPGNDHLPQMYQALRERFAYIEAVLVATCNRVELYIARPADEPPSIEQLRAFLAQRTGVTAEQLTETTIHREQDQAVSHLFRVCTGLESMVLGEAEILGQVKRAYEQANLHGTVGPVLHRVFQDATTVAKRLRHETGINQGRTSVGSVAVDFARQVFTDFSDKTVLGLGAGEMAKLTLRHLLGLHPGRLWLSSRRLETARDLAGQLGIGAQRGGARAWEELDELLVEADVIIASTGSAAPVLSAERFKPLLKRRRNRPLFIIDVAVPRDVEQAVGALNNVYLYNIDDLNAVIDATAEQRQAHRQACEARVREAAADAMWHVRHRDIGKLIRQLRNQLHELGDGERQRTARKIRQHADPGTAAAIDDLLAEHTHRLINKILHMPLSQLDQRDRHAPLGFYAAALRRLFDLDDHDPPREASELADNESEAGPGEQSSEPSQESLRG